MLGSQVFLLGDFKGMLELNDQLVAEEVPSEVGEIRLVRVKLLIELDVLNRTYMLNWLVSLRQLLASVPAAAHDISLCINETLDL